MTHEHTPTSRLERVALILVSIALLISVIFAAVVVNDAVDSGNSSDNVYVIDTPVEVTNRIDGIEGPAAFIGEDWETVTYRCLTVDEPVVIRWITTWQSEASQVVPGGDGSVAAESTGQGGAGCAGSSDPAIRAPIPMPEDITPGVWRFVTDLTVHTAEGEELGKEASTTEWVTVVAVEG